MTVIYTPQLLRNFHRLFDKFKKAVMSLGDLIFAPIILPCQLH